MYFSMFASNSAWYRRSLRVLVFTAMAKRKCRPSSVRWIPCQAVSSASWLRNAKLGRGDRNGVKPAGVWSGSGRSLGDDVPPPKDRHRDGAGDDAEHGVR